VPEPTWTNGLQAVPLSKDKEIFHCDKRYYLGQDGAIWQAPREFSDRWDENLWMLIMVGGAVKMVV
jgi:hypothetical protein